MSPSDFVALLWFICCWTAYTIYAHRAGPQHATLAKALHGVRRQWIDELLQREMRIADITALGALQRNVTFFASTTLIILAGLLTVLGATEQVIDLADTLPFVINTSRALWEIKLLLLIAIFIYAFFKFSWCVRQYNFALVMVGGAPMPDAEERKKTTFTEQFNVLLNAANQSFTIGLRSYNFALAALAWFIHPQLFIVASAAVVAILYRREFRSRSLVSMQSLLQKDFDESAIKTKIK